MKFLSKLLNIKEGEGKRVFRFALYFFLLISALIFGNTARDTFFLSRFNPDFLPIMFIIVAVVIGTTVVIYTKIASRFAQIPFAIITSIVFGASLLVIQLFLSGWMYPFLYAWMEVIGTIMVTQFWLLANSAFTTREAKRVFGIIGSGGAIAFTLMGFSIRPFVNSFGTDWMLTVGAVLIGLCALMATQVRSWVSDEPPRPTKNRARLQATPGGKKSSALLPSTYLKTMTVVIAITAIVVSLIEYQFKIIASQSLSEAEIAGLFGTMYGVVGVASIIIQFFITGRILAVFGVLVGLLLLPLTLIIGSTFILLSPVIFSALVARTGDLIFRLTVNDTTHQLLWLPVAPFERGQAKPFIDGTVKYGAQGLSGLIILGVLAISDLRALSGLAILLIVIWVVAVFRLKRGYVHELMRAIQKRRLDFESLQIDITDPIIVQTLQKGLTEGDDHQKMFVLETMKDLPLTPWVHDIRELFHSGSPMIRREILDMAAGEKAVIPDEDIIALAASDEDPLTGPAMIVAGQRKLEESVPVLQKKLRDGTPEIRAAAAAGIILAGGEIIQEAHDILNTMLNHPEEETQIAALKSVRHVSDLVTDDGLEILLTGDSLEVRRLAIQLAGQRDSEKLIPLLVQNLDSPITALDTRRTLRNYAPTAVASAFLVELSNENTSPERAVGIVRCLSDYPDGQTVGVLIDKLTDSDDHIATEAIDTLVKVVRTHALTETHVHEIEIILNDRMKELYADMAVIPDFHDDNDAFLLIDLLRHHAMRKKVDILKLSLLPYLDAPVERCVLILQKGDPAQLANMLEILDNILAKDVRENILPLLDDSPLHEKIESGKQKFNLTVRSKEDCLVDWLTSSDLYRSAVTLDYILTTGLTSILVKRESDVRVGWRELAESRLHRETVAKAWPREGKELSRIDGFVKELFTLEDIPMYTTLEKTIFLKGVSLFKDLSGEDVSQLAHIAEEVRFSPLETIFKEGDVGNSMFIIVDGNVRIHKDEKDIATLSKGEFIGEMALLDQDPRSASATTEEETVMLRIEGQDFYDLMASRMEIMQGIVKVLTGRLREAIA